MRAKQKHVLVLGAYGLIGRSVVRRLISDGHHVVCLGRNKLAAQQILPEAEWQYRDLREMTSQISWEPLLADTEFVVNCAGVLQDNGDDHLDAVHHTAIAALASAASAGGVNLIQISAAGATFDAATKFMRTKAAGDAAICASGAAYTILRPGLVIAKDAYGGSLLLRMLASVPLVQILALPDATVQTVNVGDVATSVSQAIDGKLPANAEFDLVEAKAHSLKSIVAKHRAWLGNRAPLAEITLPRSFLKLVQVIADALGHLGWRSPLRSTAIAEIASGVTGDPEPLRLLNGNHLKSLDETLTEMTTSPEQRLYVLAALLMPVAVASLSLFWALSGAIGLFSVQAAATTLTDAGWSHSTAVAAVILWSFVDLGLAALLLIKRHARLACCLMMMVSVFYLAAATIFTPGLWLDPLGPLVKIIPALVLAGVTRALIAER